MKIWGESDGLFVDHWFSFNVTTNTEKYDAERHKELDLKIIITISEWSTKSYGIRYH